MKFKKHEDTTTAQVKFALARGEIESNIPDFLSAKFVGYEKNGHEVHLVEGLNFSCEPNFNYQVKIDPSTGKAYFRFDQRPHSHEDGRRGCNRDENGSPSALLRGERAFSYNLKVINKGNPQP